MRGEEIMRNVTKRKNGKKYAAILMLFAMMICGLTACNTNKDTGDGAQAWNPGSMYMGEITAIDGKELTVNVMGGGMFGGMFGGGMPAEGELPEGFDVSKLPEGGTADGKTFEGTKPENLPEGFDKNNLPEGFDKNSLPEEFDPESMPEGFDPESMPEGFDSEAMMEGETMTIKVTNKTEITINGEKGKVSNLQVGDFIQFTMEDEKVTSISVGMTQQFMPQQFQGQPATK